MSDDVPRVRVVELDWRTALAAVLGFAALVVVTGLARSVPRTLSAVAIAVVIALGLDPAVTTVSRRLSVPRGGAVALVGVAAVGVVAVLAVLMLPPAVDEARDLGDDIPRVVADLNDLPVVGDDLERAGVPERVERFVEELPDRLGGEGTPLVDVLRSAAGGFVAALLTFLLAVTLVLDGDRLVQFTARLLPDRAPKIGRVLYRVVGKYVAGSLLVAGIAGVATLAAGLALGVPLAPLIAAWVMVWNLIPQIGGAVGGIPFVLLAATQGAGTGLLAAAFFVLYLQIENNVLQPIVIGQAVRLSPPATMTAALIGVSAGGVVGALLAVPLTGAVKALYLELRPPAGEADDLPLVGDVHG